MDTMMLPTHALAGMALAVPVVFVAPEFAGVALVAGLAGGVAPDLDMYAGHRRAFHYPVYLPALSGIAVVVAALIPAAATVGTATFLLAAAVHSVSDVGGGGLELRPWEARADRAVYDHYRDRWLAPRRWIRYDGSPEDLLLSAVIAAPLLVVPGGVFRGLVVAILAVAVAYTALRRTLPEIAVVLVNRIPRELREYVPSRYLEGSGESTLSPARAD